MSGKGTWKGNVEWLKGTSPRMVVQEFADVRKQFWGRELRARGCFAVARDTVTGAVIKEYVVEQEGELVQDERRFRSDDRPRLPTSGRSLFTYAEVKMIMGPQWRYVVVDIPPALYLSQRYVCAQVRARRVFRFCQFGAYSDRAEQFGAAGLTFVLPHPLELLRDTVQELFVAVGCLHDASGAYQPSS